MQTIILGVKVVKLERAGLSYSNRCIANSIPIPSHHHLPNPPGRHLVHSIIDREDDSLKRAPRRHEILQRPACRPEHPPRCLVVIRIHDSHRQLLYAVEIEDRPDRPVWQRIQQPIALCLDLTDG